MRDIFAAAQDAQTNYKAVERIPGNYTGDVRDIQASTKSGGCSCRGVYGTHTGPCSGRHMKASTPVATQTGMPAAAEKKMCAMCTKAIANKKKKIAAGGPGSGRKPGDVLKGFGFKEGHTIKQSKTNQLTVFHGKGPGGAPHQVMVTPTTFTHVANPATDKAKVHARMQPIGGLADHMTKHWVDHMTKGDLDAGGPGSGRHKTGISDFEKQSVMHLRRSGFKTLKQPGGGRAMSMQDSTGKTHTMNFSKGGFKHTVSNKAGKNIKQVGQGTHKQMGNYAKNNFAPYKGKM